MASLGGVNGAGRVEMGNRWPRSAAIVLKTFALFNVLLRIWAGRATRAGRSSLSLRAVPERSWRKRRRAVLGR